MLLCIIPTKPLNILHSTVFHIAVCGAKLLINNNLKVVPWLNSFRHSLFFTLMVFQTLQDKFLSAGEHSFSLLPSFFPTVRVLPVFFRWKRK